MIYHAGMTGSRFGCHLKQYMKLKSELDLLYAASLDDLRFHVGCCVGADEQAAMYLYFRYGVQIIAHPPKDKKYLSSITMDIASVTLPPADYLARNRDIVRSVTRLIATPSTSASTDLHSGTWYTVHRAIEYNVPVTLIFPDGSVNDKDNIPA